MENNEKRPYYIFMDIDGTLYDNIYANQIHGPYLQYIEKPCLNPKSINAINFLLQTLENNYDTKLVITSGHRNNMSMCLQYLYDYGLKYDKPIFCTDFVPGTRGKKIIDYLNKDGKKLLTYPRLKTIFARKLYKKQDNQDFKDYVVIDDKKSIIRKHIPPERRIITNKEKQSLTMEQVIGYLTKIGIELENIELEK